MESIENIRARLSRRLEFNRKKTMLTIQTDPFLTSLWNHNRTLYTKEEHEQDVLTKWFFENYIITDATLSTIYEAIQ